MDHRADCFETSFEAAEERKETKLLGRFFFFNEWPGYEGNSCSDHIRNAIHFSLYAF